MEEALDFFLANSFTFKGNTEMYRGLIFFLTFCVLGIPYFNRTVNIKLCYN